MSSDSDYLVVLKALQEIPFGVGKKLLIEFLQGKDKHESIKKNKLYDLPSFGSLAYDDKEIDAMIEPLLLNSLIQLRSLESNRFWKVMELSPRGIKELESPTLHKKKLSYSFSEQTTPITDRDRELFSAFGDFLSNYNDEQKKAIIHSNKHILCIAGAGSGKTTVLTKRIEFLMRYRSVPAAKILAITFTRKARQEMIKRLGSNSGVAIETFNSFCEKTLRQHGNLLYGRDVRVVSYGDKIRMMNKALFQLGINMNQAIDRYFSVAQRRSKTNEQLARIFLHDCFFIRDYFKFENKKIEKSAFQISDAQHQRSADMVFAVSNFMESYMTKHGLRDFADQLIDTLKLFKNHPHLIPKYDYVLIDEFQDVNKTQIEIIDTLNPQNLFCVGDPRQSIFGWRGSNIGYILKFAETYPNGDTIVLTKNYRSASKIVSLMNKAIDKLGLAGLQSCVAGEGDVRLLEFANADAEYSFVVQAIQNSTIHKSEIFVLARTNKQLNELSMLMKRQRIPHTVRSDEMKKPAGDGHGVTLATVHAIKGMEAHLVIVVGCTSNHFPCKASEHPVVEMVKVDSYDKEEEERRLFYVAISRAKKNLYLTYTGKRPTHYITDDMLTRVEGTTKEKPKTRKQAKNKWPGITIQAGTPAKETSSADTVSKLKTWRSELSRELGVPAYIIMHDRTIFDISVKMPMDLADLEKVVGLGPAKIAKYGESILDIVVG